MLDISAIDVHAHFLPPAYCGALDRAGLKHIDGNLPFPSWSAASAISRMDDLNIAGAVLSLSSPFVSFAHGAEAVQLCRQVNDYAAGICREHPGRFGSLAILPLPDVEASIAELDRALGALNLDGVVLPTNVDGIYPGDPRFGPLLQALNEHKATVLIHPTGPCCFDQLNAGLPAPVIEFPFDSTRAAVSLLYSGSLDRFSDINFIFTHAGGTIPYLAKRITMVGSSTVRLGDRAIPVEDAMRMLAGLYYDLALAASPVHFNAINALASTSQMLFGSDAPFAPEPVVKSVVRDIMDLPMTAAERRAVLRSNAEGLFPNFASRCVTCISA